ncbi:MAG: hypothetical protein IIB58_06560 [Planctomycetes bacterium]|nr:hypothetical protein [Planctomycetota bacterium]
MPRRTRNKILIAIIGAGLLNFLAYTIIYAMIGGDAKNGGIDEGQCFLRGHFLRLGIEGHATQVSRPMWIYSYVHSISIWPTIGAVLCCMLLLARPHIIATMQEDSLIRGQSFVTAAMTIIIIITGVSMIYFVTGFVQALSILQNDGSYGL